MNEENNNQEKKEMTMDDLAVLVTAGFEKSSKQTDEKIESLARIVQKSFLGIEERFEKLDVDVKEIKANTENTKAEVNKKVDRVIHNELVYRVEKLEKKFA